MGDREYLDTGEAPTAVYAQAKVFPKIMVMYSRNTMTRVDRTVARARMVSRTMAKIDGSRGRGMVSVAGTSERAHRCRDRLCPVSAISLGAVGCQKGQG